jgi:hypothetical protein
LSCQQIEIQDIVAISSFTYIGTELTSENEEEIEICNIITAANKALLCICDLHAENINSEYTRIYIAIKLNIQGFNWTSTKLQLQSVDYDSSHQEKG